MSKKIDWELQIKKVKPDFKLAQQISKSHKLDFDTVCRFLELNVITATTLSLLCGYADPNHINQKIKKGYLTCCYPFAITIKKKVIKSHMFVKVDDDCVALLKRRSELHGI